MSLTYGLWDILESQIFDTHKDIWIISNSFESGDYWWQISPKHLEEHHKGFRPHKSLCTLNTEENCLIVHLKSLDRLYTIVPADDPHTILLCDNTSEIKSRLKLRFRG